MQMLSVGLHKALELIRLCCQNRNRRIQRKTKVQ